METGNPKQVAALGVVAVGAFAFLFTRLGGPKALAPLARAVETKAERKEKVRVAMLLNDPFSHPRLAPVKPVVEAPSEPVKEPVLGGGVTALPAPSVDMEGMPVLPGAKPLTPSVPKSEEKEKPRPSVAEGTLVSLEATAGASDAVAFLSVAGRSSEPFRPADRLAGGIRLLRVDDGSVLLSGPHGRRTLGVGETVRL